MHSNCKRNAAPAPAGGARSRGKGGAWKEAAAKRMGHNVTG